jgi:8-oxo-dGTP pyrophosphatase MutT (NUDIX family)
MYSEKSLVHNLENYFFSSNISLPGHKSHMKMAPSTRNIEILKRESLFLNSRTNKPKPKVSAILILFYLRNNTLYTAMMKRANDNSVHSNQISFPGGKFEDSDNLIINTALREANEELGINIDSIKILGMLSKLYIPPSNFDVYPVIGYTAQPPSFVINEEVERLMEVRIEDLLDDRVRITKPIEHSSGKTVDVPCYFIDNEIIWGATAMIISELTDVLKHNSHINY